MPNHKINRHKLTNRKTKCRNFNLILKMSCNYSDGSKSWGSCLPWEVAVETWVATSASEASEFLYVTDRSEPEVLRMRARTATSSYFFLWFFMYTVDCLVFLPSPSSCYLVVRLVPFLLVLRLACLVSRRRRTSIVNLRSENRARA